MRRTIMKWRVSRVSEDRLQVDVFLGAEGATLQNAGRLTMRDGEYQIIAATIGLGEQRYTGAHHFVFQTEGDECLALDLFESDAEAGAEQEPRS